MAFLTQPRTGARHALASRTLVGRSPLAQLRLDDRQVSNEHAVLSFHEGQWWVRDMASRNGTWVEGKRIEPQQPVGLTKGTDVAFGTPKATWTLSDASPPGAFAQCAETGEIVLGEDGLLLIPSADNPLVAAFADGMGGWMVERDEQVISARDIRELAVEDRVWTLVLPFESMQTWGTMSDPSLVPDLVFHVSSDEEHVEIELVSAGSSTRLPPRSHSYFLLLLARQRIEDVAQELSPAEQGWLHAEDLCRMLRMDRATLNQRVFRARQQLAATGLIPAADVIERRAHTGQLRIGLPDVSDKPLT